MSAAENASASVPSASEYILDNFEATHRIAMLVLNRDFGETIQRIRCGFYRPKNSVAALFLEGKRNLLRLQQDIPLTEAEANAVADGVNAFKKLLAQLSDVPIPEGPTPRQLQSGLVQIQPTNEGSK